MKESILSSWLKIGGFEESSTTVSYHRILYIMKYANEILHMICKLSGYDEVKVFCKITIFPVHQRAHFVITIRFYLRPVIWRNKLKLNKVSTISCRAQITLYGTNRSGIIEMYKIKCGTNDIGSRAFVLWNHELFYENGELRLSKCWKMLKDYK